MARKGFFDFYMILGRQDALVFIKHTRGLPKVFIGRESKEIYL